LITLQKEHENPHKKSFFFQDGNKIVVYGSILEHWNCNILQHFCTAFGFYPQAIEKCFIVVQSQYPQVDLFIADNVPMFSSSQNTPIIVNYPK